MVLKTIAPYGEWESKIDVESLTANSRGVSAPRVCKHSGRIFFLEFKPPGIETIVELLAGGDVTPRLPDPYGVGTRIHEYGGVAYAILTWRDAQEGTRIIFSNLEDHAVCVLDVDSGHVRVIVSSPTLRFGDFDPHPHQNVPWVVAIQEDHAKPRPAEVRNYVVAIHIETGEVRRLAEGADFYTFPRFSPDGRQVSWKHWNHPGLPFMDAKLSRGKWVAHGGPVEDEKVVAGHNGQCTAEPRWGPDGSLYFAMEAEGDDFLQMFRLRPGRDVAEKVELKGLEDVEVATVEWLLGSQTYQFLTDKSAVVAYTRFGRNGLIHVDLETLEWRKLDLDLIQIGSDSLQRLSPTSFLAVGSGAKTPSALYRVDLDPAHRANATTLRTSTTRTYDQALFSVAQDISLNSTRGPPRDVHAFYWPPHNPKFVGPEGTLPPLIINSHGGPTSYAGCGLALRIQFWTSRGYGYAALNYTGSAGHGKRYRERLYTQWGILDRDDTAELIRHMTKGPKPLINPKAVGIEGGSAGGYHTLQSLVWYPELFAAGISCYGISDAKILAAETHKLESHYCDTLFFGREKDRKQPPTEAEKDALFYERSPIKHAERITSPLLIMHGENDQVVPVNQAYEMEKKILADGGEVRFVLFKGEGHGWTRDDSWVRYYQESEAWWRKTLASKAKVKCMAG